jgi:hypothetical protein
MNRSNNVFCGGETPPTPPFFIFIQIVFHKSPPFQITPFTLTARLAMNRSNNVFLWGGDPPTPPFFIFIQIVFHKSPPFQITPFTLTACLAMNRSNNVFFVGGKPPPTPPFFYFYPDCLPQKLTISNYAFYANCMIC